MGEFEEEENHKNFNHKKIPNLWKIWSSFCLLEQLHCKNGDSDVPRIVKFSLLSKKTFQNET